MREDLSAYSCADFVAALASKAPVPGGGGASALVGALGAALAGMVGSLTAGKKKYAAVEDDIRRLKDETASLQSELLGLIQRDAEVFEPLARAYALPVETADEKAEKARVLEGCLKEACEAPLEIMRASAKALRLCAEAAAKGSRLALSDAGAGAVFCKAALLGASLNVYINTASMTDRAAAAALNGEAAALLAEYEPLADQVFSAVRERLVERPQKGATPAPSP